MILSYCCLGTFSKRQNFTVGGSSNFGWIRGESFVCDAILDFGSEWFWNRIECWRWPPPPQGPREIIEGILMLYLGGILQSIELKYSTIFFLAWRLWGANLFPSSSPHLCLTCCWVLATCSLPLSASLFSPLLFLARLSKSVAQILNWSLPDIQ